MRRWIGMRNTTIPSGTLQDDRYFLSGSLDGKLRLWNIPDKKVIVGLRSLRQRLWCIV